MVAFNISDSRPSGERIIYLTDVGGDEYPTGLKLGLHALAKANTDALSKPRKVLYASHDSAHQGLKARRRDMETADVEVEKLFIGAEPAKACSCQAAGLGKLSALRVWRLALGSSMKNELGDATQVPMTSVIAHATASRYKLVRMALCWVNVDLSFVQSRCE